MSKKKEKIEFTAEEIKALDFVIGNGYGDGDIFQDGLLDTKKEQTAFFSGWKKIKEAK